MHKLRCPQCGLSYIKRNGLTHYGKQNYRCKDCDRQFVEDSQHIGEELKDLIKVLLLERLSLRGIYRVTGVSLTWLLHFITELYCALPDDLNLTLPRARKSAIRLVQLEKEHELVNTENLASRKPRQLKLGDQEYQLKVIVRKARSVETLSPDCVELKLALVFGKQTQVLATEQDVDPVNSPRIWKLLWAGDVDGDGKLDLYVNLSSDGVGDEMKLFLSSQAKPGQFVKEVGNSAGGN